LVRIKDLNVIPQTTKCLAENIRKKLLDIALSNDSFIYLFVFGYVPKAQATKTKAQQKQ
jgi:hypothetical protein